MVSNNIKFTHQAKNDIDQAIAHIINEFCDKQAAKKLYDTLLKVVDRVRSFPNSSKLASNELFKTANIRQALVNNYLLFYLYDESKSTVVILRFIYAKRSIADLLKEISI